MIDRRIEYLLERLHPHLEHHRVALSASTAAAVHHLSARDITHHIDLLATSPLPLPDADHLAGQLQRELDQIHPLAIDTPARHEQPIQTAIGEDRIDIAVPTRDGPIIFQIVTLDPDLQPAITTPRALRRGGMRFPTLDQVTVARQLTMRWLTDPHDAHHCLEVALAADRVGPEALWTERTAAATAPLARELHAIVQREAPVLIHGPSIPRRLARQAQRGLDDLQRHLAPSHTRGRGR